MILLSSNTCHFPFLLTESVCFVSACLVHFVKIKDKNWFWMSTIFEENLASTRFGFNCLIMRRFFDSLRVERLSLFIQSRRLDDDFVLYIRERCFLPFFFFHSSHDHSFMSLGRAYPCGKSIQRPAESITALFHPLFNVVQLVFPPPKMRGD